MLNKVLFLGLAIFLSASVHSQDKKPLKRQIRFAIPEEAITTADAAEYFLEPYGFKLYLSGTAPIESSFIANQPLPGLLPFDRLMTIEEALLAIIGRQHIVVIDNENKLVSFSINVEAQPYE